MQLACILRCLGVGVFVVSLHAGAQAPEAKGRPAQAGASPFIRFPVPQRSVGVIRQADVKTYATAAPRGKLASGDVIEISTHKRAGPQAKPEAERLEHADLVIPAEPRVEKKAALPECGAR